MNDTKHVEEIKSLDDLRSDMLDLMLRNRSWDLSDEGVKVPVALLHDHADTENPTVSVQRVEHCFQQDNVRMSLLCTTLHHRNLTKHTLRNAFPVCWQLNQLEGVLKKVQSCYQFTDKNAYVLTVRFAANTVNIAVSAFPKSLE